MPLALLFLLLAFLAYGGGEYAREVLRKPYGIRGVIYTNGIRPADVERFRSEGFLASTVDAERVPGMSPDEVGALMYGRQCASCHTVEGYRSMTGLLAPWDEAQLKNFIYVMRNAKPGEQTIWSAMPPLVGNAEEIEALQGWLRQFLGR